MADETNKTEENKINVTEGKKKGAQKPMITIVPRFYVGIFAGIILILGAFLCWAFFGHIDRIITVSGVYHPTKSDLGEVIVFVPLSEGKPLEKGMRAKVFLSGYDLQKTGFMEGVVTYVDPEITSMDEMRGMLTEETIVSLFAQNGPMLALKIKLKKDNSTNSGFYWSEPGGRNLRLYDMTITSVNITLDRVRPIALGIPQLKELFKVR